MGITLLECSTGAAYLATYEVVLGLSAIAAGRFPYETPERAHLDFWELLECLTEQPPPVLPSEPPGGGSFSAPFRAFVEACLQKDPAARASATELAQHAWLEPRDDEIAGGGPSGAAGEALLAELVRQAGSAALARRSVAVAKMPPLQE